MISFKFVMQRHDSRTCTSHFYQKTFCLKELARIFNKYIYSCKLCDTKILNSNLQISIAKNAIYKIILLHVSNERSGLRVTIHESKSFPLGREIFGSIVLTGWMVLRTILYRASDWCFHIPH